MGFLTGLASVNETLNKRSGGDFEERVKAKWLSLKDGESAKIIFLQELDEGSPNYSEKNGVAKFFLEHSNPDNWRKKAECTVDEGTCYGCQRGWRQSVMMYVNVLVDNGKDEPYVAVYSRGTGKGSVAKQLLEIAADEDFNHSISDKLFKFSRTGKTKDDTTYTLGILKAHDKSVDDYELYDLTKVVFHVNPDRQEAYYLDGQEAEAGAPAAAAKPASAHSIDADW
jgi:hypothetical protein